MRRTPGARWLEILPKVGALRGRAASLLAAAVAIVWMPAWAQVDSIDRSYVPDEKVDPTADAEPVRVPAFPKAEDLVGFFVSEANAFKFFIDAKSIAIGADGVVRYTLVARSPDGVDNVSYEGIRCRTESYRIYATGHADGSWSKRIGPWRRIEPRTVSRWRNALLRDYFCPANAPILSVAEGIEGLKNGRALLIDRDDHF